MMPGDALPPSHRRPRRPKRIPGRVSEKDVQAAVVRAFRAVGCTVWSLSQARATQQTPGLPDLFITHPARGLFLAWETKAEGGRLRPEQRVFRDHCVAAGVRHYVGGLEEARAVIEHLGFPQRGAA